MPREIFLQRRERRALDAFPTRICTSSTAPSCSASLTPPNSPLCSARCANATSPRANTVCARRAGIPCSSAWKAFSPAPSPCAGRAVKVETLRAGQHFGEGSIFKATSRSTTVTAEADSLVYEIERHVIEPLLDVRLDLREQLKRAQAADRPHQGQLEGSPAQESRGSIQENRAQIAGKEGRAGLLPRHVRGR